MRLSIKALQYFLTAIDQGSITHAAQHMNVVPSAISSAIDAVESEFGLKLVQRFPAKGIKPTASGITIARKVRRLIEEYDDVITGGHELRDALSGQLSIGYYAPIAPAFLPTILAPMLKQNRAVHLQCTECNNESVQDGLLEGRFDVILFVSENVKLGITCETLIDAPPHLLVPSSHRLAKQKSVKLDQIATLDLVLLDLPFTTQYLRGLLDSHGIDPRIVASASSTEMVRNLVGAGVGCSILNMRPELEHTYSGARVVAVPIEPPNKPLRLVLGYLDGNARRIVRTVNEACLSYFKSPAAQKLIVPIPQRPHRRKRAKSPPH